MTRPPAACRTGLRWRRPGGSWVCTLIDGWAHMRYALRGRWYARLKTCGRITAINSSGKAIPQGSSHNSNSLYPTTLSSHFHNTRISPSAFRGALHSNSKRSQAAAYLPGVSAPRRSAAALPCPPGGGLAVAGAAFRPAPPAPPRAACRTCRSTIMTSSRIKRRVCAASPPVRCF